MSSLTSFLPRLGFTPSHYQTGVLSFIESSNGNAFVKATAGSGKTTTLVKSVQFIKFLYPDARCTFLAFNKAIAVEIGHKCNDKTVEFSTFHSIGFRVLREAGIKRGGRGIFWKLADSPFQRLWNAFQNNPKTRVFKGMDGKECREANNLKNEIVGMIGLVKNLLLDWNDKNAVATACATYDRAFSDESLSLLPYFMAEDMRLSETGYITFDDMLYLPVIWNLKIAKPFDFVLVDEAQDMNNVQEKFLSLVLADNGRIIAVGDTAQAIYGFRGSNVQAVESMTKTFGMHTLPLSISYRCPLSHIQIAREYCADIEPRENAPEGIVDTSIKADDLTQNVRDGDLVISRCNAPLIGFALQLVKEGRKAVVRGADIGKGLVSLVQGFDAISVSDALEKLTVWQTNAIDAALKRQASTQGIDDRAECVRVILESCGSVAEFFGKVERIFSDECKGVTFSTIHKAKGLENHRVFFLEDGFQYKPNESQDWQREQLRNLRFVAVTRSTDYLAIVQIGKPVEGKVARVEREERDEEGSGEE